MSKKSCPELRLLLADCPAVGSRWMHYKGLGPYRVLGSAIREADQEPFVVYENEKEHVAFARPLSEWHQRQEIKPEITLSRFYQLTEAPPAPPKPALVFVDWYCNHAVYLDGMLIYYGAKDAGPFALPRALGYNCEPLGADLPTCELPPELDRDPKFRGHWLPPAELTTLQLQVKAWRLREKLESLTRLKQQVEELEKELADGKTLLPPVGQL